MKLTILRKAIKIVASPSSLCINVGAGFIYGVAQACGIIDRDEALALKEVMMIDSELENALDIQNAAQASKAEFNISLVNIIKEACANLWI